MSYMHIDNLYKSQMILLFRECYALEKIHGTSAHVEWKDGKVVYFSGGSSYDEFVKLFNEARLVELFTALGHPHVIVYGEAYGGKVQGMKDTYGPNLRFVVFEVKIGDTWLSVPNAEDVTHNLELEFIHYKRVSTDVHVLDAERDADSVQAVRNGCGEGKKREGVVLRPLMEMTLNDGKRLISKHKSAEFSEVKTPREVRPEKMEVMRVANEIAEEWVTPMRLEHVLDKMPGADVTKTGDVIKAMLEDVEREASGEIEMSREAKTAIGKKTARMFKERISKIG